MAGSSAMRGELLRARAVIEDLAAAGQRPRAALVSPGLASNSQRRRVMPLVLLTMRSGYRRCRSAKTVCCHQLGVQRRHAVDPARAEEGEVPIRTRRPWLSSMSEMARGTAVGVGPSRACVQVQRVDQVDDLHVPRQQPFHQRHRPALERLRQQRVIGVGSAARLWSRRSPTAGRGRPSAGASAPEPRSPDVCR